MSERSHRYLVRAGVDVGQRALVNVDDQPPDITGEVVEILADGTVGVRRDQDGQRQSYHPLDVYPEPRDQVWRTARQRTKDWVRQCPADQLRQCSTVDPAQAADAAWQVLALTLYAAAASTGRRVQDVAPAELRQALAEHDGPRRLRQWWQVTVPAESWHPSVHDAWVPRCRTWADLCWNHRRGVCSMVCDDSAVPDPDVG